MRFPPPMKCDAVNYTILSVMTLSQMSVWIAQNTPRPLKSAIHRARFLDRALMSVYGALVKDRTMTISDGPMKGV